MALQEKILWKILDSFNQNIKDYKYFIETGTNYGDTVEIMSKIFEKVITIELSSHIYNEVIKKFNNENIQFILGDSSETLKSIVPNLKENAVFFLDAHWSMGDTARGNKDVPLLEELKIIDSSTNEKNIIIIDDVSLFETYNGVSFIDINENSILECFKNRKIIDYKYTEFKKNIDVWDEDVKNKNEKNLYKGRMIIFTKKII